MLLAEHGTFHHVHDFAYFELPFGIHVPLPNVLGFQFTKFMVLQVLAAIVVVFIFRGLAHRIRNGETANGWWWNFWEMLALYVRDEVVRPIIGDPHLEHEDPAHHEQGGALLTDRVFGHLPTIDEAIHTPVGDPLTVTGTHPADRYAPFVWSCFFYVLICNLFGAVPILGSATGAIAVTGALAVTAFIATYFYGAQKTGVGGFWTSLIPHIDAPGPLKLLLIPMMFGIEILGLFIRHAVLAVRLFANIMGGHTVLGVILGFIAMAAHSGIWFLVTPASIFGQVGIGLLELLVAFIQAYVFAFLATIFIGMALHPH